MAGIGEMAAQEARKWIGTPYCHQASRKGAGTDCLGLILGVWRCLYGSEPTLIPPYTFDWSEPSGEETLWMAASKLLVSKTASQAATGDILLFRMKHRSIAKHMGIAGHIGPQASFIHAYCGHAVVESALSSPWRRRVVARFEFPKEMR